MRDETFEQAESMLDCAIGGLRYLELETPTSPTYIVSRLRRQDTRHDDSERRTLRVFGLMYAHVCVSLYIYVRTCVYVSCVERIEAPGCSRPVAPYDLRALTLARVSSCNIGHGSRIYCLFVRMCMCVYIVKCV